MCRKEQVGNLDWMLKRVQHDRQKKTRLCFFVILFFHIVILNLFQDLFIFSPNLQALTVGSDTVPSRQAFITFPDASVNTILGYAAIDQGFTYASNTTTCTFNSLFPVSGPVGFSGGQLFLNKDISFEAATRFMKPGWIRGNQKSVTLLETNSLFVIPYVPDGKRLFFSDVDTFVLNQKINSTEWAFDASHIVAVTNDTGSTLPEATAFTWTGTALVRIGTFDVQNGYDVYCVRWHPSLLYYALVIGPGNYIENDIRVYQVTGSTITERGGGYLTGGGYVVRWHPSGTCAVTGSNNRAAAQIRVFPFDSEHPTNVFHSVNAIQSVLVSPVRDVYALGFEPRGAILAAGTRDLGGAAPQLLIYDFNLTNSPSFLSLTSSVYTGTQVNSVDWSFTGTYLAVGLNAGAQNVRIYKYDYITKSLTETATRIGESRPVKEVHWDKRGDLLLYSTSDPVTPANSTYKVYYFDRDQEEVYQIDSYSSATGVNCIQWSVENLFMARGNDASQLIVAKVNSNTDQFIFDGTVLNLNANLIVRGTLQFRGVNKIIGNGNTISFVGVGNLRLRDNASLQIQNVCFEFNNEAPLLCLTDNGSITLRDCSFYLTSDFTFSRGALTFENDVLFSGPARFTYRSALAGTIASGATLYLDKGMTFSYDPLIASKDLLVMSDVTSGLYLNGASLVSTRTGLHLSTGTLYLDNYVTFSSQARNSGEAIELSSGLNIHALAGAVLDMFGIIKYV